ncbi:MAG: class I SAM-dependent methyltransferase [Deltaproteobacteria bacterium]|nr:class I SAM-dependent methyltransferase [Deltaproteobacteria bacterium]
MSESNENTKSPRGMDAFYRNPNERAKWGADVVGQGLFPTEAHLLDGHFPQGGEVLDIGCGGGREAFGLAARGYHVTAVDAVKEFVEQTQLGAQERGLPITAMVMDATRLEFADGAFDAAVMVGQLVGHIRGRDNRVAALAEARRVVKPGGVALFSTNAIEVRRVYRFYFLWTSFWRRLRNPHRLEAGDAFVFRQGGRRRVLRRHPGAAVFHWYRVPEFQADLAAAGWTPGPWVRRADFEGDVLGGSGGGETFHIAYNGAAPVGEGS